MDTTVAKPTAGPWKQDVDGAIALNGALQPDQINHDDDVEYRPQLEGVIDYDPGGYIDGGLYGFQVEGPDGRGICIVEWHGDEHDAEDRANLRAILAVPQLLTFVKAFADAKTTREAPGWWSADQMDTVVLFARSIVAEVEGGS